MDLPVFRPWLLRVRSLGRTKLASDESGATAVEFALLLPVLCLLLFAIIKFGVAFNNYIQLTNAAAAGSRALAISRDWNPTSGAPGPFSSAMAAARSAAPNLNGTTLQNSATLSVSGTRCTDDNSCLALLTTIGQPATALLTYPCDVAVFTVLFPNCTLSASSSGAVQ